MNSYGTTCAKTRSRGPFLCEDIPLLHLLLGQEEEAIATALAPDGQLRMSGLMTVDEDGDITLLPRLMALMNRRANVVGTSAPCCWASRAMPRCHGKPLPTWASRPKSRPNW
ncbi:hypothetical protein RAA17_01230 [Komagataeibacter rhaeticus]|nr:hypothetical protein [Komagataeibacter rhaeticus]